MIIQRRSCAEKKKEKKKKKDFFFFVFFCFNPFFHIRYHHIAKSITEVRNIPR